MQLVWGKRLFDALCGINSSSQGIWNTAPNGKTRNYYVTRGTAEVAARSHSERSKRLVKAFWRHAPIQRIIQPYQIYASAQCMSITWMNSYRRSPANKYPLPPGREKRDQRVKRKQKNAAQVKECSSTKFAHDNPALFAPNALPEGFQ